MTDILFSILSFILGALAANLYQRFAIPLGDRRVVANDREEMFEEAIVSIADLTAENARLQAELEELRRGLDALGRVDLGG